jgi:hypothetical protein
MATVSEHGIYDLAARYTLRDSIDALAGDQRHRAARSGRERIACESAAKLTFATVSLGSIRDTGTTSDRRQCQTGQLRALDLTKLRP